MEEDFFDTSSCESNQDGALDWLDLVTQTHDLTMQELEGDVSDIIREMRKEREQHLFNMCVDDG